MQSTRACVPVSRGEGGLACRCRVGRGGWAGQLVTAVQDAVTSSPATSCPALVIACALHGPRIRAGRGSALTPHVHDICRRVEQFSSSCDPSSRYLETPSSIHRRQKTINHFDFYELMTQTILSISCLYQI